MSNPDFVPTKRKTRLYVGIIAVVLVVVIVGAVSLYRSRASDMPTLSSMAGTYVQQASSGTGYTIILYKNGTGLFSTYSGTWHIVNATTFVGTYRILSFLRDDYFTITNNGFTSVQTGNVYVKQ